MHLVLSKQQETRQTTRSSPTEINPAAIEDILAGGHRLRAAFLQRPLLFVDRGEVLISGNGSGDEVALIRSGVAYRCRGLTNGSQAIVDILLPGDIVGLDRIVLGRSAYKFIAASRLGLQVVPVAEIHSLMADQQIALCLYGMLIEGRLRAERLAVSIGRLDAQARICLMLLDIHDRLRRRNLISRPTFNLPMSQEQIADHLGLTFAHVNRTLRRLRDEKLVLLDRQVVIILELDQLREMTERLSHHAELPEPPFELDPVPQVV